MSAIYTISATRISGEETTLQAYADKVMLIVNTASQCGFTRQYEGLQRLYETYHDRGFVVLGFPSNDFLRQEPGTDEEIQEFCRLNFGVTFPMFSKIVVRGGSKQHPLYNYLTDKQTNPEHSGRIQWNFNKFLIARDGTIINRFGSRDEPESDTVTAAIEAALSAD